MCLGIILVILGIFIINCSKNKYIYIYIMKCIIKKTHKVKYYFKYQKYYGVGTKKCVKIKRKNKK